MSLSSAIFLPGATCSPTGHCIKLGMRKIALLSLILSAACAPKPQVAESKPAPKIICNPASKGLWLYENNQVEVCAPNKEGVLGWQQLTWTEPKAPASAPSEPAK